MNNRIRIQKVETLSDDWYVLRKSTFEYQRRDGVWQTLSRETYDRGNGATILLYNTSQQTVILTRQFRFPAFVNEHDGVLIEACAGLLNKRDPTTAIQHEAEEETGYHVGSPQKVFEAFMSPGSVTEKLYFFIAEYQPKDKIADGGGLETDGKTIMLLQHLALSGLMSL